MRTIVSFNEGWLFTKQGKDEPVTLSYIEESDREARWAGWKQEKKCQKPGSA